MSELQTLARGLQILDLFADTNTSLSITEIADHLNIDKSIASRMVKTLVNSDYVQPEPNSRRYILGKRLHIISGQLLNRIPVREQAKPYLYRLMQTTGECAHTAVYSQGRALVIDDVESNLESSLKVVGGIGRRIPLHCTAVGKSLLAFSGFPVPGDLPANTQHTITDPVELVEHLEYVQRQGYAYDNEENEYGVRCLAAPIYDYTGMVIATIGISGPTVRLTPERVPQLGHTIMQAAYELSNELGYRGSYHPNLVNSSASSFRKE